MTVAGSTAPGRFVDTNPPYLFPPYIASRLRSPMHAPVELPEALLADFPGPRFDRIPIKADDHDLNHQHEGLPIGQRIILFGKVLDRDGVPVPRTLVEIWQANGAGRYADETDAAFLPLDPNFTGSGRCLTDEEGNYRFFTLRPAAYPGERGGLYRPSHIHASVFGEDMRSRLITQCYFPDDPLLERDPILQAIPDPRGLHRLTAKFRGEMTELNGEDSALAYEWNIVLRGRSSSSHGKAAVDDELEAMSASQTIGPLYGFALMFPGSDVACPTDSPDERVRIVGRVLDGAGEPVAFPEVMVEIWDGEQFARTRTDEAGAFTATLRRPRERQEPGGLPQAPCFNVAIFARGLLKQVVTRLYLAENEEANARDAVLQCVDPARRRTLVYPETSEGLELVVHLQGEEEAVFFDF